MKIATWNVERLKHITELDTIQSICSSLGADILVLTETDERLALDYPYCHKTEPLTDETEVQYKPTERRVSIYTKYPCVWQYPTFDSKTALCVELRTERGNLIVYGTIIGIYGNRHRSYMADLQQQLNDLCILPRDANICVCGDYNCSFSDNYYFTKTGRACLLSAFEKRNMAILTMNQPECIDHIALSQGYIDNRFVSVMEWNEDKTLSDHKGVLVQF